jgi:hypothetical protein
MKKILVLALSFPLMIGICFLYASTYTESELTGWVSDTNCGADHTKAGGKDCVEKCIRGGADIGHPEWKPQDRVFVSDDEDHKIWIVKNQDALKGYEGEHVKILAKIEGEPERLEIVKVARIDKDK